MPDLSHDHFNLLSQWPDEAIWEAFKTGSTEAFNHIYRQYSALLYNYGRQITTNQDLVKDCIQDLFVVLWQSKENLGKTDSIKFYLLASLRRSIIESEGKYRKAASRQYLYQEENGAHTVVFPFEDDMIQLENFSIRKKILQEALNHISPRQKEVVFLLYYHNLSYEEVAHIMEITTRSVYTLAWKATEALRKKLHQLSPLLFALTLLLLFLCLG